MSEADLPQIEHEHAGDLKAEDFFGIAAAYR
jgi:hypothetical protein